MKRSLIAALVTLGLTACGAGSHPRASSLSPSASPSPSPSVGSPAHLTTAAPVTVASPPRITKVLTVVEENHGTAAAMRYMPYLASMARTYGRTTAYRTLTHPSLPNYLAMAGGSTFGVRDDADPARHRLTGPSVMGRALARHRTSKTYAEAMPAACSLTSSGRYAVRHNPWTYFADPVERLGCRRNDVPAGTPVSGALHTDIARGTLPNVGLLIPDLCHDAHNCSLATADRWLKGWLPQVMKGPDYRAGRLAIVVTFDEDEGRATGDLLTVVVAPRLHGRVASVALSHLSWSRWMADLVGAAPLRSAARATSLGRAFGL